MNGYNQTWPVQHKHYDCVACEFDKIDKLYHITMIDHQGRSRRQYQTKHHDDAMILIEMLQSKYSPK